MESTHIFGKFTLYRISHNVSRKYDKPEGRPDAREEFRILNSAHSFGRGDAIFEVTDGIISVKTSFFS